jgi:hypothetical protein
VHRFLAHGCRDELDLALHRGWRMPGEALMALAQFAGQTVTAAAITDGWETARHRFARLLGCGDARRTQVADQRLAQAHWQLTGVAVAELKQSREVAAQQWAVRFADLLDEDPSVEAELRALVEEVAAQLAASSVSAAGHSVAAGQDVTITANRGGIAAGVIHGNVAPPNPTTLGSAPR